MTESLSKQQILEQRYLLDDEQEQFMNAAERSAERDIERRQAVGRSALQEACGTSGHVMSRGSSYLGACAICGGTIKTDKQVADSNLLRG